MATKKFAHLRIAFGLVWLVDAYLKWQPAFRNGLAQNFHAVGMPALLSWWAGLFGSLVSLHSHFFGILLALSETAIALSLIFGFMTRFAIVGGIILSFIIWTTAEGLGMFWVSGATDMGASVAYIMVFVALWLGRSWETLSLDSRGR